MRKQYIAISMIIIGTISGLGAAAGQSYNRVPQSGKSGTLYKQVIGCASETALDDLQYALNSKDYNSTMAILASGRCTGARAGSTYTMIDKGSGRSLILVDGNRIWINTEMLK